MKKLILSIFVFCVMSLLMVNCSTESSLQDENSTNIRLKNSGSNELTVGYIDNNLNFIVYNDSVSYLKSELEKAYKTQISSFTIEKKTSVDDPNDSTNKGGVDVYILIGQTSSGSIGVPVIMSTGPIPRPSLRFVLPKNVAVFSVSCTGCSQGCNIDPYGGGGHLRYRCANPCGEKCVKTETLTGAPTPTN